MHGDLYPFKGEKTVMPDVHSKTRHNVLKSLVNHSKKTILMLFFGGRQQSQKVELNKSREACLK